MVEKEKLKWNENLIYFVLIYIVINALFVLHASTLNGGSSLGYLFILPLFWLSYIIFAGIYSYNQRQILFEKKTKKTSIFLLFLCTPFPYLILVQVYFLLNI
jgi:hypothetical protein